MFRLGVFFLLIFSFSSFAQKDSSLTMSHCVGGGMQWLTAINYGYDHDETDLHYNAPSPYGFYRFQLCTKKENKLCFTLNGYERKGYGSHSGGGLGGSQTISGTFDFLRLDVGINWFWCFGRNKGTSFGIGTSLGFIPYIQSDFKYYYWSMNAGFSQKHADSFDGINYRNFSLNCEFNQQFKLNKESALVIGIRAILETPDGFVGSAYGGPFLRSGKVITSYIAYRFWKRSDM
jgi:hypothetical protein